MTSGVRNFITCAPARKAARSRSAAGLSHPPASWLGSVRDERGRVVARQTNPGGNLKKRPLGSRCPVAGTIRCSVLALVLALIIKSLFVQAFYIPSPSMEPLSSRTTGSSFRRSPTGVVRAHSAATSWCQGPGGWLNDADTTTPRAAPKIMEKVGLYRPAATLVKRVIGVGGDRVVCCDAQGASPSTARRSNEKAYLPQGTAPSQIKFDRTIPRNTCG